MFISIISLVPRMIWLNTNRTSGISTQIAFCAMTFIIRKSFPFNMHRDSKHRSSLENQQQQQQKKTILFTVLFGFTSRWRICIKRKPNEREKETMTTQWRNIYVNFIRYLIHYTTNHNPKMHWQQRQCKLVCIE